MASSVLVTSGLTGPSKAIAAVTYTGVTQILYDLAAKTMTIVHRYGTVVLDINATTTLTTTITAGANMSVTVNQ